MLSDTLHQAFLTQTSTDLPALLSHRSFPPETLYRTPVYVYLVSYAFQPEKLKLTTWYVLVPSHPATSLKDN